MWLAIFEATEVSKQEVVGFRFSTQPTRSAIALNYFHFWGDSPVQFQSCIGVPAPPRP